MLMWIFAGCNPPSIENTPEKVENNTNITMNNDTLSFKTEYESLNNNENLHVQVPEDLNIHLLDFEGVKTMLSSGSWVLYFGFPTCPWCRNLLPELFVTLKQNQIFDLYVFDPKTIRDTKKLDEQWNIITEVETSVEYQRLLDRMDNILPAYKGLNDEKIKRLYVPFLVVIKDWEIIGHHLSTLEEQEDPKIPLTDAQKKKLQNQLTTKIFPLINTTCSIEPTQEPTC